MIQTKKLYLLYTMHSWVTQHINAPPHVIFPIIYLEYFLALARTYDNKCFDRRIVAFMQESCIQASGKTQLLSHTFDTQTQETIHKIARGGTESVAFVIANAFHEKHGKMMFARDDYQNSCETRL